MTTDQGQDSLEREARPDREKGLASPWRAPQVRLLPPGGRILVVLVVAVFAWLVAEIAWPVPELGTLDLATGSASYEPIETVKSAVPADGSLSAPFFSRKLFIPEVPVESRETSRAVVAALLARLKLTGIVKENDEFVALVRVGGRAPDRSRGSRTYRGSPASTPKSLVRIKKGDDLLDFKVEKITDKGLELSIAGFRETLTF